jgi:hypothetical protein
MESNHHFTTDGSRQRGLGPNTVIVIVPRILDRQQLQCLFIEVRYQLKAVTTRPQRPHTRANPRRILPFLAMLWSCICKSIVPVLRFDPIDDIGQTQRRRNDSTIKSNHKTRNGFEPIDLTSYFQVRLAFHWHDHGIRTDPNI